MRKGEGIRMKRSQEFRITSPSVIASPDLSGRSNVVDGHGIAMLC